MRLIRATTRPAPTYPTGTYRCARCGIQRGFKGGRNRPLPTVCRDCRDVLTLEGAS